MRHWNNVASIIICKNFFLNVNTFYNIYLNGKVGFRKKNVLRKLGNRPSVQNRLVNVVRVTGFCPGLILSWIHKTAV